MNSFILAKKQYEIIHDNLNCQWFICDLTNKKYKFYHRYLVKKNEEKKKKVN